MRISQVRPLIGSAFICLTVLSSCGSGGDTPPDKSQVMAGNVVAPDCDGGYGLENSRVPLRNETNDIIGTATTSSNQIAPVTDPCVVGFEIEDVPRAKFYTVTIGSHEGPAWSLREMEAGL